MIGVAGMVGGSMFILIGIASGLSGPSMIIAFIINGAIALITAMSYAELGSAFPEAGGGYLWVKEALPRPNPFISGWLAWFAHSIAGSLYALSFGSFFTSLFGAPLEVFGIPTEKLIAALAVTGFTLLNIKGVSETARTGSIITILQILLISSIVVAGAIKVYHNPGWEVNFTDYFPTGILGLMAAMSLSFIAFEGYEIIAQAGEEVKNPKKSIPLAIFISLGTVTMIYVLLAFVTLAGVPASVTGGLPAWQWLGNLGEDGVLEAARLFMPLGAIIVLVAGVISTLSALNATTYSSSRLAYAMGRAFNLPFIFSRVCRYRTPHIAIIVSSVIMVAMIPLTIAQVAVASGIMFILLFTQVNLATIIIRRNFGKHLDYGFKVPLFPFLPILGIILKIVVAVFIAFYQPFAFAIAIVWLLIGYAIYKGYVKTTEIQHVAPLILEEGTNGRLGRRVVVVLGEKDEEQLARVAISIAQQKSSEVDFLKVVLVPRRMPLSAGILNEKDKEILNSLGKLCRERKVPFHISVKVTHDVVDAILVTIHERRSVMVILPIESLLDMKRLLVLAPCDVVGCRVNQSLPEKGKIVVAYDLGRHSLHTIDIAYALARAKDSTLYVLNVNTEEGHDEATIRKEVRANLETIGVEDFELAVVSGVRDPVPRIAEIVESIGPDLLVIGAGNPQEQVFSRKTDKIVKLTNSNLVIVKGFDVPILGTAARLKQKISRSVANRIKT